MISGATGGGTVNELWKVCPTTTMSIAPLDRKRSAGVIAAGSAGANNFATEAAAAEEKAPLLLLLRKPSPAKR